MNEQHYKVIGWSIFIASIALALYWCLNENGLTGWFIRVGEQAAGQRLGLISWILTILIVVLPGYILKNYLIGNGLECPCGFATTPRPDTIRTTEQICER